MISKNGIALGVLIVEALLSALGIEFEAGSVDKAVEGAVIVGAFILAIWNQLDRTDTKWFFFKK